MQSALVKMILGLLTKSGLKMLLNQVAKSAMFKEFIQGLILSRVEGLRITHPETYASIEGYTIALSTLPEIFTDDNKNDLDQVAVAFRLKQLEQVETTFEEVSIKSAKVLTAAKKARIRV